MNDTGKGPKKDRYKGKPLEEVARLFGVGAFEMHIFLCTGPDCCTPEQGQASWQVLKDTVKAMYPRLSDARIYRTKVNCLRMCREGPIALCYPQGKWFRHVSADRVPDLVRHLAEGREERHELEFIEHPIGGD